MIRKNKYYNCSRLSEAKFREVIKCFSVDLSATQIAQLTQLNLNTINKILTLVRIRIFELSVQEQLQSGPLVGQIEVDESYFGEIRVKGRRGRGARGKTIAFGLLKRGDKVYIQIVEKCDRSTLYTIIKDKASTDIVINSDGC